MQHDLQKALVCNFKHKKKIASGCEFYNIENLECSLKRSLMENSSVLLLFVCGSAIPQPRSPALSALFIYGTNDFYDTFFAPIIFMFSTSFFISAMLLLLHFFGHSLKRNYTTAHFPFGGCGTQKDPFTWLLFTNRLKFISSFPL